MSPPAYDGQERRAAAITEDRVELMISQAVQQALTSHEQHLMAHMDKQFAALRQTFAEGFPGGDPHGHRIAHERMIETAGWWDKVKSDAVGKVTAAGLWAVVVLLCVAVWDHVKGELKR